MRETALDLLGLTAALFFVLAISMAYAWGWI